MRSPSHAPRASFRESVFPLSSARTAEYNSNTSSRGVPTVACAPGTRDSCLPPALGTLRPSPGAPGPSMTGPFRNPVDAIARDRGQVPPWSSPGPGPAYGRAVDNRPANEGREAVEEKSRFTVVLADRDEEWSGALAKLLRREGIVVDAVHESRPVLERLDERAPDLLVLDSTLEELGVDVLLRLVRQRSPRTPVLLITPERRGDPESGNRGLDVLRSFPRSVPLSLILDVVRWIREHGRRLRPRPRPPVILCVDDDRACLDGLARLLRRRGYSVADFEDPESALEAIPVVDPDLAFVDIRMPGMSGHDLAREIRELRGPGFPFVFLTACGSDADILNGYREGASYYITKPCDPQTVLNIADYLLADLDPVERRLLEAQL